MATAARTRARPPPRCPSELLPGVVDICSLSPARQKHVACRVFSLLVDVKNVIGRSTEGLFAAPNRELAEDRGREVNRAARQGLIGFSPARRRRSSIRCCWLSASSRWLSPPSAWRRRRGGLRAGPPTSLRRAIRIRNNSLSAGEGRPPGSASRSSTVAGLPVDDPHRGGPECLLRTS
jgi:hypothetical protein